MSNKKKLYNAAWTNKNTKSINIRFNNNDPIWNEIKYLKEHGYKLNQLFKDIVHYIYSNEV